MRPNFIIVFGLRKSARGFWIISQTIISWSKVRWTETSKCFQLVDLKKKIHLHKIYNLISLRVWNASCCFWSLGLVLLDHLGPAFSPFFLGFAQDLLEVTASINPQQNGGGKPSSEQWLGMGGSSVQWKQAWLFRVYIGVSLNGGFTQQTHGFPTKFF